MVKTFGSSTASVAAASPRSQRIRCHDRKPFIAALLTGLLCLASGALSAQGMQDIVKEKLSALP
ncbi:MAG: hypothetical protein RBT51_11900, partial [Ectothiorhodospiraceae bacterium]|nr:hypothetical protein [Ectothiorhodospiraceae bacterium]